ncbi:MAG: nitroreductase [Dictyoglomaceae bacterium]
MRNNEVIKNILERRSIRSFKEDPLSEEDLLTILHTGRYAPSGMNRQPWLFTVIKNKDILKRINELCRQDMINAGFERAKDPNFCVYYNAPLVIVISGDKNIPTAIYDCILAMGNMLISAWSIGVGACWIHAIIRVLNSKEGEGIKRELRIPENHEIYASGAFGYIKEMPEKKEKREDVFNIID